MMLVSPPKRGLTGSLTVGAWTWRMPGMTDDELMDLRARAADGDRDATDELVELAGERGDLAELRRLADGGSSDAGPAGAVGG
jgi:hypothetical protein